MLRLKFFLIYFLAISTAALAYQEPAASAPVVGLGKVSFPISCKPEVRPAFERGVALLHSFQYAAAQKAFTDVSHNDPQCAMAYWGLAMATYHPLWEGADAKALARGRDDLDKAKKLSADKREREYIAALDIIFTNQSSGDRVANYSRALGNISKHYPEDGEAQASSQSTRELSTT